MPCADAVALAPVPDFVPSSLVAFSSSRLEDFTGHNALNVRLVNHFSPLRAPLASGAWGDAMDAAGNWSYNGFAVPLHAADAAADAGGCTADCTEQFDGTSAYMGMVRYSSLNGYFWER